MDVLSIIKRLMSNTQTYISEAHPSHRQRFDEGVWIMSSDDASRPQRGRTLSVHDDGAVDIVIYGASGERSGRMSTAMGRPRGFEPYCSADRWQPIRRPGFEKSAMLRYNFRGELVPLEGA